MKKIVIVSLMFLIAFIFTGSWLLVTGKINTEKIQVTYRNISIQVNGKIIPSDQEPFLFGGRTFVPLRTIGEALNKKVDWDSTINQVIITDIPTPSEVTTVNISINGFAFNPNTVTINTGSTVIWTNSDNAGHNIKSDLFTSPMLAKGESFSYIFKTIGTFNYICGVHPSMKGTIVVK